MLSGFPFGKGFVDIHVSKVLFDATTIVNIAAEQASSYVFSPSTQMRVSSVLRVEVIFH